MARNANGHVRVPDWLLERSDISGSAKLAWSVFRRLQGKDAVSYPAYDTVAAMMGTTRRHVLRYVDELESAWLLEIRIVSFSNRETNLYGYKSNLFVAHEISVPYSFPTRLQQRIARQLTKAKTA